MKIEDEFHFGLKWIHKKQFTEKLALLDAWTA